MVQELIEIMITMNGKFELVESQLMAVVDTDKNLLAFKNVNSNENSRFASFSFCI